MVAAGIDESYPLDVFPNVGMGIGTAPGLSGLNFGQ